MSETLEDRVRRLEQRTAIEELRAEYCYRIDDRDWDGFADLFTEDAFLSFGPVGDFEGREEVRRFAEHVVGARHPFLAHMIHNPKLDLDLDGDDETATGSWYFEVPCTFEDGTAGWIQGIYRDEYEYDATTDRWRFASVVAEFNYFAEYDEGWADVVAED